MHLPVTAERSPEARCHPRFFAYLREQLPMRACRRSVGLVTVSQETLASASDGGSAANFDAVCPMVYPSHYAHGFRGFENRRAPLRGRQLFPQLASERLRSQFGCNAKGLADPVATGLQYWSGIRRRHGKSAD